MLILRTQSAVKPVIRCCVSIARSRSKNQEQKQSSPITHAEQPRKWKQIFLMTCQAKVTGPHENVERATVYSEPGAACSFVYERLAQQLRLQQN